MKVVFLGITAAVLSFTAGCSATNPPPAQVVSAAQGNPVTITDFAGRQVVWKDTPKRIAALGSGELDIVYALGGELVGRPTSATAPSKPEAAAVQQIGTTHGVDLEKLALVRPDAVLGNNPLNLKDAAAIEGLGSKLVLTHANSLSDLENQIKLFGELMHKEDRAKTLIQTIQDKRKELAARQPAEKVRVLMIYGAPGTYMAALNNSLSGDILQAAGGQNIAADYPALDKYPQYAQLNTEKIIKSNPQLIVLMTHGKPEQVKDGFVKEMQQNAAWSSLDAVKNNRIEVLPADLFGTNPGTRVTEALELMYKLLAGSRTSP